MLNHTWQFLVMALAGFINRQQQDIIEYLREENRVLREKLGHRRLLLNEAQKRRLSAAAAKVGREMLYQCVTLFSPETLLKWYRQLIARKYDGSGKRGPKPEKAIQIRLGLSPMTYWPAEASLNGKGNSADSNAYNEDGYRPLHLAARYGSPKVAQLLLRAGAKVQAETKTHNAAYPLDYAGGYGHMTSMETRLAAGADREAKDASGRPASDWAIGRRSDRPQYPEITELLRHSD